MSENIQCHHCDQNWPSKLFNALMDVFCPTCGKLLRLSEEQSRRPEAADGARTFWNLVGFVAALAGISAILQNLE